jgi:hypothetical protein
MDLGLLGSKPKKCKSNKIQEAASCIILWNVGAVNLFLHPTQSAQGAWRYCHINQNVAVGIAATPTDAPQLILRTPFLNGP